MGRCDLAASENTGVGTPRGLKTGGEFEQDNIGFVLGKGLP